jgi:hypothetical protein
LAFCVARRACQAKQQDPLYEAFVLELDDETADVI